MNQQKKLSRTLIMITSGFEEESTITGVFYILSAPALDTTYEDLIMTIQDGDHGAALHPNFLFAIQADEGQRIRWFVADIDFHIFLLCKLIGRRPTRTNADFFFFLSVAFHSLSVSASF
jgi:hypothetical protein